MHPNLERIRETIFIDFETYYDSDYTLRALSNSEYLSDPRFEIVGVGVRTSAWSHWFEADEFIEWAKCIDWATKAIVAHNTHFDASILAWKCGINPGLWLDTMAMSHVVNLGSSVGGSLAALAELFGVGVKDSTNLEEVKGIHRADMTQLQWDKLGEYCLEDCRLGDEIFQRLLKTKVDWATELAAIDINVRCYVDGKTLLDPATLVLAAEEESTRLKKAFESASHILKLRKPLGDGDVFEAVGKVLSSRDKFADVLRYLGEEPPLKKNKKGENTFAFAKSDAGFQLLLEHPNDSIRLLAEAKLVASSSGARTRIKRFQLLQERFPTAPIYLKFAQTQTHRYSGGDKVNFQNLKRGSTLRKAIVAPPGMVLWWCDSSNIEVRKLAWLADDEPTMDKFRMGRDLYNDDASIFYGRTINRKNPSDAQEGNVGKTARLSLGYMAGYIRFAQSLYNGPMGAPSVVFRDEDAIRFGVNILPFALEAFAKVNAERLKGLRTNLEPRAALVHAMCSKYIVDKFRESNPSTVQYWANCDRAIAVMAQDEGEMDLGPCRVQSRTILLPSGNTLHYPGLRKEGRRYQYIQRKGKARIPADLYGGKLAENISQASARDVIVQQVVDLDGDFKRGGIPSWVSNLTHDEVMGVCDASALAEVKDIVTRRMSESPAWALRLPLACKFEYGENYGK